MPLEGSGGTDGQARSFGVFRLAFFLWFIRPCGDIFDDVRTLPNELVRAVRRLNGERRAKWRTQTDEEIERAATAEFQKYADSVKDVDDLSGVQLMAQEQMLKQLIRIRLELSALRLSLGGAASLGNMGL